MKKLSVIPVHSFAVNLLPVEARERGTVAFNDAVVRFLSSDFARQRRIVLVTVDLEEITIVEFDSLPAALEHILPMLNAGKLPEAIKLLESLTKGHLADAQVLYNLGIAYSELSQYDEAVIRLKRAVLIEPGKAHAWVGIGTAYERMGKPDLALPALQEAVRLAPGDGYAQRNLGAVLAVLGQTQEGVNHLRLAVAALPQDPQALYGLALTLSKLPDNAAAQAEADALFDKFVQRYPNHEQAETAREMRTAYATQFMRAQSPLPVRMDAVFYILSGLQKFEKLGPVNREAIAMEIAVLGRQGLDINDPESKYKLRNLEGEFSGMHLLALMYAAFQQIDPKLDVGVDFSKEYESAMALHARSKERPK